MERKQLHRLIYRSHRVSSADPDEKAIELDLILEQARVSNAKAGITGVLINSEQVFVQVLEGPLGPLSEAFEKICRDTRHAEISLVEFEAIEERELGDWPMADLPVSNEQLDHDNADAWSGVHDIMVELQRSGLLKSEPATDPENPAMRA